MSGSHWADLTTPKSEKQSSSALLCALLVAAPFVSLDLPRFLLSHRRLSHSLRTVQRLQSR